MRLAIWSIVALFLLMLGGVAIWGYIATRPAVALAMPRTKRSPAPAPASQLPTAVTADAPAHVPQALPASAGLPDLMDRVAAMLAGEIAPRGIQRNRLSFARQIAKDRKEMAEWKEQASAALASDHPEVKAERAWSQIGLREQDIGRLTLSELGTYNRAVKQANDLISPTIEHDGNVTEAERLKLLEISRQLIQQFLQRTYQSPDDACSEMVMTLMGPAADHDELLHPLRMAVSDAYIAYQSALDDLRRLSPEPSIAAQQRAKDVADERLSAYGVAMQTYIERRLALLIRQIWVKVS